MDFGDKLIGVADLKNAGLSKRFEEEGKCKKVGGPPRLPVGYRGSAPLGVQGAKAPEAK